MRALATTNACHSLPRKIWGLICAQADDFTLLVVYRQVSRLVRSEAEREFARTHLPKLCVEEQIYQIVSLSKDGQQARLQLNVHVTIETDDVASRFQEASDANSLQAAVNKALTRALEDTDIDFGRDTKVPATVGSYTNNNPLFISKIDVRRNECFIDFKSFLCAFYGDYARVGRRLDPQNPYQAVLALLATFKDDIIEIVNRHSGIVQISFHNVWKDISSGVRDLEVERLFQQAYLDRVKQACTSRGVQFTTSIEEIFELRWNLYQPSKARARQIYECVKREQNASQ
ncbi:hypothetical protein HBI56_130870 [Parastagonospora nodorum]|uniref:Uncharacterized protein n=2 Tax=Phaeosphaeria nodorum (strain SN15 / ATCC MYA-4574 / FGSC 10173) TaxID=321614 RepID=A0A7U2EZW0_PHANO|nr:hypothetical protein SNOG_05686 [Parastagonospora nodorum SN15]KAH3909841.1 hypothetical protein HBH56_152950 [Parastagonospora nodorum]EAT86750.2 hypothetical protein SNOG_05686 [Parastagonospora nodorum SN15]KAH3926607.1 hypothetical protein HBH54_164740 [Parastagonospora nodorum]KAH3940317.1 hypothetical protein HBH53_217680 [Parastagonospora nodorum]KAH3970190.1 hypothetical protein HBH52_166150 [Parastagonospora nodorum]